MKLNIFVVLGCFLATMTFISCSGEDGAVGPTGGTGAPGNNGDNGIDCWDLNADGVNDDAEDINGDGEFNGLDCVGKDGAAGQDGNANVIRGTLPLEDPDINNNIFSFMLYGEDLALGITQQEVDNYVFLFYIKDRLGIIHQSGSRIPYNGADRYTRTAINSVEGNGKGNGSCLFYNLSDDSPYFDWDANDALDSFIVVALEVTSDNKGNQIDLITSLKAAGVDTSDYHKVTQYFGLE